jgi:hypothetical protein
MDSAKVSYDILFGVTWGVLAFSLISAIPVIWFKIQDTVTLEEDLKFSDETIEDVVVAGPAAEALRKGEA